MNHVELDRLSQEAHGSHRRVRRGIARHLQGLPDLSRAAEKTGQLDAKTRERIALAVSVTTRCDGCITVHSAEAVRLGATKAEIAEALGVAVALNAGAAMVYSARAFDALESHGAAAVPAN